MQEAQVTAPIVVVGAGGAGMMAALRAADLGAEVLLLEKSVRRGCNSELSGGMVQAAGTRYQLEAGVEDSPELMWSDIMRKNGGRSDPQVVRAICDRSRDVVHFLAERVGLDIHLDLLVRYYGHSAFRMHATPTESGAELIAGLRRAIANQPAITLVDEAHVSGLGHEAGAVTGVKLARRGQEFVGAGGVLLATGGFGGNRAMLQQYCPEIAEATYIGSENVTGEGIRWGIEAGAAVDLMTAYQGHSHVNPRHGTRLGGGLPSMGAIMVNLDGVRFEREDQGYSEFARVILAQPGGVAVEIFDERIFDIAWHTGAFREAFEAGAIRRADSPEELAGHFGLDAQVLSQTLDTYNRAARTGHDSLGRQDELHPLRQPLYGSLVTGAIAHTQGGLRIDPSCHVIGKDGRPTAGLYAAGGTAAGISGAAANGYLSGNGLIQAFATGMIAAETMVASTEPMAPSAT